MALCQAFRYRKFALFNAVSFGNNKPVIPSLWRWLHWCSVTAGPCKGTQACISGGRFTTIPPLHCWRPLSHARLLTSITCESNTALVQVKVLGSSARLTSTLKEQFYFASLPCISVLTVLTVLAPQNQVSAINECRLHPIMATHCPPNLTSRCGQLLGLCPRPRSARLHCSLPHRRPPISNS